MVPVAEKSALSVEALVAAVVVGAMAPLVEVLLDARGSQMMMKPSSGVTEVIQIMKSYQKSTKLKNFKKIIEAKTDQKATVNRLEHYLSMK